MAGHLVSAFHPLRTLKMTSLSLLVNYDVETLIGVRRDEIAREQIEVCVAHLILMHTASISSAQSRLADAIVGSKIVKLITDLGRFRQLPHPLARRRRVRLEIQDHRKAV